MSNSVIRNQKAKLAADYHDLLQELTSPKLSSIGCYTLGKTIGRGTYGKVKLGVHQLTCRLAAIKKISKKHAPLMAREIHHHRQLHHPNIVSLYEILSTETSIFIVSEHCPHGDLFEALLKTGRFSEPRAKKWFSQLIDAIQYCHSLDIIHRDLKLENILLDEHDNVKVCDFGFARHCDKNQLLDTFCGSLAYSAPEVIQRQNYSGPATDIWSLGVILYTLLAGELPFDDDSESELQRKVVKTDYYMPTYFSADAADLIQKILKLNPHERSTLLQIRQHPWLNDTAVVHFPAGSASQKKIHEQHTADSLLHAGFDTSVVNEMRLNKFGMLGTLWTMLLSKTNHAINVTSDEALLPNPMCGTQIKQDNHHEDSWIDTLKFWRVSRPIKKLPLDNRQLPTFTIKTMAPPPIITNIPMIRQGSITRQHSCETEHPASTCTVLTLAPIHPTTMPAKKEDEDLIVTTLSTCSSAADDSFDDDDEDDQKSVASSPATSVASSDDEQEQDDDQNACTKTKLPELDANYNMTAFHSVSPMPSRADVFITRSRFNIITDARQNTLRYRLANRMIIEEEEEEDD